MFIAPQQLITNTNDANGSNKRKHEVVETLADAADNIAIYWNEVMAPAKKTKLVETLEVLKTTNSSVKTMDPRKKIMYREKSAYYVDHYTNVLNLLRQSPIAEENTLHCIEELLAGWQAAYNAATSL